MKRTQNQYLFSVEGETEEWYLRHLQKLINEEINKRSDNQLLSLVKFNIKVNYSIKQVIKQIPAPMGKISFHVCDYESNEEEHIKNFSKILNELKYANTNHPEYNYQLGYSNFSFDLWIILHKKDIGLVANRNNYLLEINKFYNQSFSSMKNYKKEDNFKRILQQITLQDVKNAIFRAEVIRDNHQIARHKCQQVKGFRYYKENPDLTIHECIKQILIKCGLWK